MNKHLLVHVGNPKCGSTALQEYLRKYKYYLREIGIREYCYARILKRGHYDSTFSALRGSFDRFNQDRIFLSRETFAGYRFQEQPPKFTRPDVIDLLDSHFGNYKISVVLIIRRQDTLVESSFVHSSEHGYGISFDRYIDEMSDLRYSKQIKWWSDFDELYVVPFDQYKADNIGILKWLFSESFGMDLNLPGDVPTTNVKLGEKSLLSKEQRDEIINEYEEDNKYVFDTYMPNFEYTW